MACVIRAQPGSSDDSAPIILPGDAQTGWMTSSPTPRPAAPIDRALRLRSLWIAYLLAMLFHVDLGLMPLFHGIAPTIESKVAPELLPLLFWAMLIYFLLPLAAVLRISWAASQPLRNGHWRGWRRLHFWLSVLYTITNIPHLIADIMVPDSRGDQVALMLVLLVIGLLINREAWAWWRERPAQAPAERAG